MLQQTFCWQKPDAHSGPVVQPTPGGLSPQLPFGGFVQTLPAVQSALDPQVARQAPLVPHMYSLHMIGAAAAHVPAPSQRAAAVPVEPPAVHVGSLQIVALE